MTLEDYVKEMKEQVNDIQEKVNTLIIFMEVEKEKAKRSAIWAGSIFGGVVSLLVSILVMVVEKSI